MSRGDSVFSDATAGVDGLVAMRLWASRTRGQDRQALDLLLLYNREDVELLAEVERCLQNWEEANSR
jgi:uncharacterized protein YprB with RNaseH-like and TPR domain